MNNPAADQKTLRGLFVLLLLVGILGSLMGVPWSIAVLRDPAPAWLSAVVEILFLLTPASAVGVWLGKKVGLDSRLTNLVPRLSKGRKHLHSGLLPAVPVGLALGVVGFFAQNSIPRSALMPELNNPNTLEWLLRCFSAALTEEIFFRLGLITFFVWIIRSIIKKAAVDIPSLWVGNLLSALLFAGGHLPQLIAFDWGLLIPFAVFSTSTGLIMGWLYLRYGLISAIVAHFVVDLMVYVMPRLIVAIAFA
jgi:hypothetical protein